ncbi:MotA/TolQ/ExbB proton channel family protein [Acinetobacter sp. B5B]|uniref:MotA/TolQ/ExbB proton channel family protein n=1 Tax=Acinetobacter baretiae TaxID=2605383 RepID=UPI0018C2E6FB|nr:MotA/TolQ/ExbB proton channel family protein [Acinetobacter baretiae]MBF7682554.1 MotA/TolQ/ExbB proton channel family protein [Acinetobacter baretiae]MBF7686266.1 MotA/TolQ/ExbB proton channel family protein [Acinetobacter baretiae]
MNADLVHSIIFYMMYACLAVLCVIFIERVIYLTWTQKQTKKLNEQLKQQHTLDEKQVEKKDKNPAYLLVEPLLVSGLTENERNDAIEQQYIESKAALNKGIWVLETIVAAAPLLGLLGTILGIVDTFQALAASGVSDASKVSGGMGTALYATGLGIAIALVALVANNFLGNRIERINELSKVLLINTGKSKVVKGATYKAQTTEENSYA